MARPPVMMMLASVRSTAPVPAFLISLTRIRPASCTGARKLATSAAACAGTGSTVLGLRLQMKGWPFSRRVAVVRPEKRTDHRAGVQIDVQAILNEGRIEGAATRASKSRPLGLLRPMRVR